MASLGWRDGRRYAEHSDQLLGITGHRGSHRYRARGPDVWKIDGSIGARSGGSVIGPNAGRFRAEGGSSSGEVGIRKPPKTSVPVAPTCGGISDNGVGLNKTAAQPKLGLVTAAFEPHRDPSIRKICTARARRPLASKPGMAARADFGKSYGTFLLWNR